MLAGGGDHAWNHRRAPAPQRGARRGALHRCGVARPAGRGRADRAAGAARLDVAAGAVRPAARLSAHARVRLGVRADAGGPASRVGGRSRLGRQSPHDAPARPPGHGLPRPGPRLLRAGQVRHRSGPGRRGAGNGEAGGPPGGPVRRHRRVLRRQVHRRPAVRQHELGPGAGIFRGRDLRGTPQPAGTGPDTACHLALVRVQLQGQGREHPGRRASAS